MTEKTPSKRVFIASIANETNTFSPLRATLQDFHDSFYAGPGQHPAEPTLCSAVFPAARRVARQYGWELIEGTACWAEPGGVVNQQCWEFLRDQLLAELDAAMPVDIVLLGLHGAMVAQDCLDCEGELLERVRQRVGPDVLIGATFDPHSHLSATRIDNADLITVFKEFPHTDFVETAENLIELAHRASSGSIAPQMSSFDCRMIEIFPTSREPMRSFVDRIKSMEGQPGILSISVIHGFMAGDVPDMGTRVLVITDDDKDQGDALARDLGMQLFNWRGRTRPEFLDPLAALQRAEALAGNGNKAIALQGPVIIADVWDNPGGGVPGDSTVILRLMMEHNIQNAALATIWDPIAVRTCFSAGVGAVLPLRFGGKMSAHGGGPVDAEVCVMACIPKARQRFGDSHVPMGDSVCIRIGGAGGGSGDAAGESTEVGIDVVLNTVRSQVFSPDVFSVAGIDAAAKRILVVKSTNHFHAAFAPLASAILYAAVQGPYPSDPASTPYRHLTRNIWPRVENPHDD